MKRTLSLVALAAVASLAADIKYGINAEALVGMPSLDAEGVDPKIGFGGNVGAGARIAVAEKFSVRPTVGFEMIQHGTEYSEEFFGVKVEGNSTMTSQFLTIGCGLEYSVMPNLFLAVTPEYDLSLGGTAEAEMTVAGETETIEGDIEEEESPMLVGLGLGYGINEQIAITAGYKLAVTEYGEEYKLNKVSVGVRYEL
jgi:hypothetical protein